MREEEARGKEELGICHDGREYREEREAGGEREKGGERGRGGW